MLRLLPKAVAAEEAVVQHHQGEGAEVQVVVQRYPEQGAVEVQQGVQVSESEREVAEAQQGVQVCEPEREVAEVQLVGRVCELEREVAEVQLVGRVCELEREVAGAQLVGPACELVQAAVWVQQGVRVRELVQEEVQVVRECGLEVVWVPPVQSSLDEQEVGEGPGFAQAAAAHYVLEVHVQEPEVEPRGLVHCVREVNVAQVAGVAFSSQEVVFVHLSQSL